LALRLRFLRDFLRVPLPNFIRANNILRISIEAFFSKILSEYCFAVELLLRLVAAFFAALRIVLLRLEGERLTLFVLAIYIFTLEINL
jgi:hypothetical protein